MGNSLNKVMLIGRVGKEATIKTVGAETKVATFTLATSENYKDKAGEWQEKTEWHNIVAWKRLAETVKKHVEKGSMLYVEGRITQRSWDDKEGVKKYITEIIATNIGLLSPKKKPAPVDEISTESQSSPEQPPEPSDDLPF
jgi:single-strand DNA-binding protein